VTGDPKRVTCHRQPREARNVMVPSKAHRKAYVWFSSYPKGSVVTGDGLQCNFLNDFHDHDSETVSGLWDLGRHVNLKHVKLNY